MKKSFLFLVFIVLLILLSGCATIIGGSRYYAHVRVPDRPDAQINHNGMYQGRGDAVIMANRSEANSFTIVLSHEDCESQTFNFTHRKFRGWAFAGTVIGWTGLTSGGIPLPWGLVVDGLSGALWKPDINEKGVYKTNYKNYVYMLDYDLCPR